MARHHASKKARRDEHMGMERYERGPVRESAVFYEGAEAPRKDYKRVEHSSVEGSSSAAYGPSNKMGRAMMPNSKRGTFIQEDWSEPALLKRGVHEFDVSYGANQHRAGRLGDLYEQVEKTTMEDQAAFDRLTDPHNW